MTCTLTPSPRRSQKMSFPPEGLLAWILHLPPLRWCHSGVSQAVGDVFWMKWVSKMSTWTLCGSSPSTFSWWTAWLRISYWLGSRISSSAPTSLPVVWLVTTALTWFSSPSLSSFFSAYFSLPSPQVSSDSLAQFGLTALHIYLSSTYHLKGSTYILNKNSLSNRNSDKCAQFDKEHIRKT